MKTGKPLDIAIIGMACRFPGAGDLVAYWENILAGRSAIGDVPPDRWDAGVFHDPESTANDRVYCRKGGYLNSPIPFDPTAHGIMPKAVEGGEPEQFLVLDAARAALADAGLADGVRDGRRVEVVVGRGNYFNRGNLTRLQHGRIVAQTLAILRALHPEWTEADLEAVRADLKTSLPPFNPSTVPGQLTNATAGRVANRLDLSGASYVVDAASASSLVALDLGARALVSGRADLALVGAVYLGVDVDFPMVFCQLGALSRRGEARPFSREADGTLTGEGVGVVVLKRLAAAEADGDRVYAVLKGLGLASDGRGLGLAAPSAQGHARALRRAYRRAGVDPETVGLIEGHGLGVPASDRAELRALRAVFPPSKRRALGAVSSMIGHAMPAAGMAGLIKSALALHHRVLPPTLHADQPHPWLIGEDRPASLNDKARPWIHGEPAQPRRAGVNAFGFAGISGHAVLEEHRPSADRWNSPGALTHWETEAILLGAPNRATWLDLARALLDWLDRGPDGISLKDLAFTLNTGQPPFPFRVGLVARSGADLADRLRGLIKRLADPACQSVRDARGAYFREEPLAGPGRLAFLFPGEGSQYPGMLADLCPHFPEVRALFDTADRVARAQGHARWPSDLLFGGEPDGQDSGLWAMETAVNAVLSAQWALYQLLLKLGLRPDAVAGHSSGEILALGAAGALRIDQKFEDQIGALGTVFQRLESAGEVPAAALVAVAADRDRVEAACREVGGGLTLAMDNCPHQVVVAGPPAQVEGLTTLMRGRGVVCEALPFARAYHTPDFVPALGPVRDLFDRLSLRKPRVPLYSCVIAGRVPDDPDPIRRLAVEQWARPVEFRRMVETMHDDGLRLFVEVGARGNLTGFVEDSLRGRPALAVAANLPRRSGLTQLNHLVAALFAHGVNLRTDHLYARRRPVRLDLSADPPEPQPAPLLAVGFPELRLSPALAESLRNRSAPAPAPRIPARLESSNGHTTESVVPALSALPVEVAADGAMMSYLETMDDFLETQRLVMDAYFSVREGGSNGFAATEDREPVALGPWVGEVRSLVPGRELVAVRRLDPDDDPVAENHTLGGRRISVVDPWRKGLPVVPFAAMAEMIVQAAAVLMPGRVLISLRDVQAKRWIPYEPSSSLEVRARCGPEGSGEVRVDLVYRGASTANPGGDDGPVVSGVAVFAEARAEGPTPSPLVLEGAGRSRFTAEELYRDQWLFHGPPFQALIRLGPTAPSGTEGTLRVLPRRDLLRKEDRGGLLLDVVALDAFTHLLGCWGLDQFSEGDVIFPLRMAELSLFGADPPEGSEVACRIAVRSVDRRQVRVDVELVGPDGRVWMRLSGWEDWRFYWPNRYRDVFRQPDRIFVGEPLPLPLIGGDAPAVLPRAVWLEPPADMSRPIWRDVLEAVQLAPEEWASRPEGLDRNAWLWGRIAAKEAARRLWADRGHPPVYPADLIVEVDPEGRPRLHSRLEPGRRDLPAISLAQVDGLAVALAADDPAAPVGIALARILSAESGPDPVPLTPDERAWLDRLASSGADRAEWAARLRCALQAAARSAGLDPEARLADVRLLAVDPASGVLSVRPDATRPPIRVVSDRRGGFAWAWTLGERSRGHEI